jgi:hypothetical protein
MAAMLLRELKSRSWTHYQKPFRLLSNRRVLSLEDLGAVSCLEAEIPERACPEESRSVFSCPLGAVPVFFSSSRLEGDPRYIQHLISQVAKRESMLSFLHRFNYVRCDKCKPH